MNCTVVPVASLLWLTWSANTESDARHLHAVGERTSTMTLLPLPYFTVAFAATAPSPALLTSRDSRPARRGNRWGSHG